MMLKICEYSKSYGKFLAVDKIDLDINSGETFALLGPNGSGKTTIIKSVVGLSRPSSGKIFIDGEDTWDNPEKSKEKISYLPQRVTIPENLKVGEVLKFFARIKDTSDDQIDEILEYLSVNTEMKQFVGNLSGGMLQRLGLVISFLGDPKLFVMDEPTLNLDLDGMRNFRRYLSLLKERGKTILMTSHSLIDAEQMADRVGVLVAGRLVAVESLVVFREKIKNQSKMILVLGDKNPNLVDIALNNGALSAEFQNGYFLYNAERAKQISVLEAIRKSGAEILSIATENPSLDQLVEEHYE